jgi:hypothetical protein
MHEGRAFVGRNCQQHSRFSPTNPKLGLLVDYLGGETGKGTSDEAIGAHIKMSFRVGHYGLGELVFLFVR